MGHIFDTFSLQMYPNASLFIVTIAPSRHICYTKNHFTSFASKILIFHRIRRNDSVFNHIRQIESSFYSV